MTLFTRTILVFSIAVTAIAPLVLAAPASAKGGREVIVQDFQFDKPMHGYSGHAIGGYYCDYQRLPNRVCTITAAGTEKCVIKGWTLRQMCQ